ncbi:MAG: MarC family protein [bacterium]
MVELIKIFLMAFIPMFVAFDCIGIIPVFISFTEGLKEKQKRKITKRAIITAGAIGLAFIAGGKGIFLFLGITIGDFQIAGGIVLLLLASVDLVSTPSVIRKPITSDIGVVPIGLPLILGPAVLTMLIISIDLYGILITLSAFIVNLLIMNFVLIYSSAFNRIFGKAISSAFSKVMCLLMGAIAIMMIRKGITSFFH